MGRHPTKRIAPRRRAFHVEVIGFVTAAALGPMGRVLFRVSAGLVLGLTLVVRGVGAGDVQLGLRRGGISCGRQRWRFVLVCSTLQVRCV